MTYDFGDHYYVTDELLNNDFCSPYTTDTNSWFILPSQMENKMSQTYYEYVILRSDEDEGAVEVIQDLKFVLAKNEAAVRLRAAREIPEDFEGSLDEVEILVRPFA